MLHLRIFTGFSIHVESWKAFRKIWSMEKVLKEKLKKCWDIKVWVLWRSSSGRPENIVGTSRINLPGTSPRRHFRTSPGRQIGTSAGRQIGTFPGRPNRIFRGRPEDVRGGLTSDILGTNICWLCRFANFPSKDLWWSFF